MPTIEIQVRRFSVVSPRSFDDIVSRLRADIGRPNMDTFHAALGRARTPADLEAVVQRAVGSSGLMEFIRFDAGEVLRKESRGQQPRIIRVVVGNPLIMKEMVKHVSDAASYAPVTILIVEEANSVRLSYDTMASLIAPYGSAPASRVAHDLDEKVESLMIEIAR
jgi:uncharacterized protein (DUF302 family)